MPQRIRHGNESLVGHGDPRRVRRHPKLLVRRVDLVNRPSTRSFTHPSNATPHQPRTTSPGWKKLTVCHSGSMAADEGADWDIFVSYNKADRDWAEWIAWQLKAGGWRVLIQAWDFVPGSNWVNAMQEGVRRAKR